MHSVLLVVDDEQLRDSLKPMLAAAGYEVVTAAVRGVDAILLDVTGDISASLERAHALNEETDAAVVLITATIDHELVVGGARADVHGYLLKPIAERDVGPALVRALVQRSRARERAARERVHHTTLRSIADAVITSDENGNITFMNGTAEQLTGVGESEALGLPLNDVFSVEADSGEKLEEAANEAPVLRLVPRGGPPIIVEHNAAPIIDEEGSLHGVVVIFRDISERRRIEQRLALSDRMSSIGTLAAGIAHELNNPLAFVTSNLEFTISELSRLREDAETKNATWATDSLLDSVEALTEARDGAARAASIVKDMKVFMRGDADPTLLVDINRAVSLALRLTSNEIRHRAELVTSLGTVPAVLADEGKLVQVLVNVLTNAAQALDDKPEHKITLVTTWEDERVVIRITDTGRGIADDRLGRVFEPFFTTKPVGEGLGLGLSIAHSVITGLGGTVSIASVLGAGTALTIALPSGVAAHTEQKPVAALAAAGSSRGRVLVVDDETLIGTAIRRILTKRGIDVVVEGGGRAAFDRLVAGEKYDVVLCDLMMPGFSGVDLYEGLNDTVPEMMSRVVFMTGNAFTPRASELFQNTSNVRLEKPFVPDDLTRAVTEVMRRHGATVQL